MSFWVAPPRVTSIGTARPAGVSPTRRASWLALRTVSPSKRTITSPSLIPAFSAGLPVLDRADLRPADVALRVLEAHAQPAPAGVADDHSLLDLLPVLVRLPGPHVPRPEGQARHQDRGNTQGQSSQTLHGASLSLSSLAP